MVIIIRTKSTFQKSHDDHAFADFVGDCLYKYDHGEIHCKFADIIDMPTWLYSCKYSQYDYPGGCLVISTSGSDGNITIDWFPNKK